MQEFNISDLQTIKNENTLISKWLPPESSIYQAVIDLSVQTPELE